MELAEFRKQVQHYRKLTGHSQKDLAAALGLEPHVLSHKLNASGHSRLNHQDVKQIIKLLVAWGGLSRKAQAIELLSLMDLRETSFSTQEWAAPPLNDLTVALSPALAATTPA